MKVFAEVILTTSSLLLLVKNKTMEVYSIFLQFAQNGAI
jgi:hypothetical protein